MSRCYFGGKRSVNFMLIWKKKYLHIYFRLHINRTSQSAFPVNSKYEHTRHNHCSAVVARPPTSVGKNLHTRQRMRAHNLHLCKCIIRYEMQAQWLLASKISLRRATIRSASRRFYCSQVTIRFKSTHSTFIRINLESNCMFHRSTHINAKFSLLKLSTYCGLHIIASAKQERSLFS